MSVENDHCEKVDILLSVLILKYDTNVEHDFVFLILFEVYTIKPCQI